ncbi:hypothetical protein [Kocuria sp.]|uniref:hypothetical protein n=1 Tax=Kocuria sp. TaxID=1871328 RepID=UPI0026DB55AF|nr:hypothetical protein [Kocuria sp.]MDO4918279.1 hypothetical protein [Kocuria sp.]
MSSVQSLVHDTFSRVATLTTAVAAVLAALVPAVLRGLSDRGDLLLSILGAVVVLLALAYMLQRRRNPVREADTQPGTTERGGMQLLLYLSPVIFLNIVFPLVSPAMARSTVGGVQMTHVVLASSITVPWLAQAACMPAYRAVGSLMAERNMAAITRRFCQVWPAMFVQALPLILVFAAALWLATGWSAGAMGAYIALCAAHVLFVQSLVLANIGERRGLWAAAWGAYALALAVAPTLWILPPLVAAATQLAALGRQLGHLRHYERLATRDFTADMVRGLLLGAVLWADKFVLFLATDGVFEVVVVFMAMLPAVLAYNFYFVNLAPRVDRAVSGLHRAIEHEPLTSLSRSSSSLTRVVDRSVLLTAAVGMVLTLGATLLLGGLQPQNAVLAVAVSVGSWAFMVLTLLSYELDYIGERVTAQVLGAAHLVVAVLAFTLAGTAAAYGLLLLADVVLIVVAWSRYRRTWTQPEYTLFWRHAISW